jgi:hypothetical protein
VCCATSPFRPASRRPRRRRSPSTRRRSRGWKTAGTSTTRPRRISARSSSGAGGSSSGTAFPTRTSRRAPRSPGGGRCGATSARRRWTRRRGCSACPASPIAGAGWA